MENYRAGERRRERRGSGRVWLLAGIGGALVLGLIAVILLQFMQLQELRDPERAAAARLETSEQLVAEVGKLMLLPDEEATVATVENAAELGAQAFFARAENQDRVLIFPDAELAVIYRPSARIIVNAGPLVLNAAELASEGSE